MLGASRPERFWLGASLWMIERRRACHRKVKTCKEYDWVIRLQAGDEVVGRAGDHGEAAGVDGVLVPVLEHAVGVLELVLDPNQRLHCRQAGRQMFQKFAQNR